MQKNEFSYNHMSSYLMTLTQAVLFLCSMLLLCSLLTFPINTDSLTFIKSNSELVQAIVAILLLSITICQIQKFKKDRRYEKELEVATKGIELARLLFLQIRHIKSESSYFKMDRLISNDNKEEMGNYLKESFGEIYKNFLNELPLRELLSTHTQIKHLLKDDLNATNFNNLRVFFLKTIDECEKLYERIMENENNLQNIKDSAQFKQFFNWEEIKDDKESEMKKIIERLEAFIH